MVATDEHRQRRSVAESVASFDDAQEGAHNHSAGGWDRDGASGLPCGGDFLSNWEFLQIQTTTPRGCRSKFKVILKLTKGGSFRLAENLDEWVVNKFPSWPARSPIAFQVFVAFVVKSNLPI